MGIIINTTLLIFTKTHSVLTQVCLDVTTKMQSIISRTRCHCPPQNEEVRFIENQLENHKQKYFELQTFTRSLILAIKSDDKEQQQVCLEVGFNTGRCLSFCVLSFL